MLKLNFEDKLDDLSIQEFLKKAFMQNPQRIKDFIEIRRARM